MNISKIIDSFTEALSSFGDSIGKFDQEMKDDIEKSNIQKEKYAIKDKENLSKIWSDNKKDFRL